MIKTLATEVAAIIAGMMADLARPRHLPRLRSKNIFQLRQISLRAVRKKCLAELNRRLARVS